jgi:DNA-binding CsgD family transcriptional regulator
VNTDSQRSLRDLVDDPTYAGRVLHEIARVAGAASPPQALEVLYAAKTEMGAEQAVFVSYLRGEDAHESYRFMLAADPRWCFEYQGRAWYGSDPWLLYASIESEPTCASRIPSLTGQQREVQALAEKYGMVSVCIAPAGTAGTSPRLGMLALGSSQRGFFEDEGFALFRVLARGLALELHGWWSNYERDELIKELRLTEEDLSLLQLELRGAGTKEASGELGSSTASIDSRWQRLNRKLGSPNRQSTARLAVKYGLI